MTDDIVSLRLELLNAKSDLLTHLQSHHDFQPVQSQFKQLVDEFDALGEHCRCIYETARGKVIPQLKSVKFNLLNEDDKRVSSASAFHEEAFSQLQELLDMHTNCSYLLKLHQTLSDLEDSINKLICECSIVGEKENWEKILNVKELKGDCKANNLEVAENYKEINEAVCRSCVDDVVHYLELAEHLFAEQTKFNKDAALVFQSMLHALIRCKDRLAQFVDELWCRWIILELPSKQKDVTPFSNVNIPYPSSIHEQVESNDFFSFSFNACLPSVDQMEKALNNPNSLFDSIFYRVSSDNDDDDVPATSPLCGKSSVLASLKILAKPGLICQLLRIIEALKESKTRIYELFNQIWTYIFKPWLKKVPCVSGSEMGWPELKCQLINESLHDKLDIDVSVNSTGSSSNNRKKTASTAAAYDDVDNRGVLCYFNLLLIAPNTSTTTTSTTTTNISNERSAEGVNNDSHNSRSSRKSTDIETRRGSGRGGGGGVEGRRSEGEDKDEEEAAAKKLINSSCKQLSNAFSDLYKYFFGLKFIQSSNSNNNNREENVGRGGVLDVNADIDGDGNTDDTAKRVIDLLINNNTTTIDNDIENSQSGCLFSHELVNELINGRFNADVFFTDHHGDDDDEKSINFESMSASITDSVRQLIHVGISTGFLSTEKQLSLNSTQQQQQQVSSSNSGETKLSVWLNNLSLLKHKRKASCMLEQLRQLLADRELFYSMCRPANESVKCEKKKREQEQEEKEEEEANPSDTDHINAGDDDDDDDEGIFEEEEFILSDDSDAGDKDDNNNNNGPLKSRSSSDSNNASKYEHIVSRLLKSKCNLRDISRHLDLGQFDFPDCMVSETVLLMMKQVNDILNNCNVYLVALVNEVNQSKANNVPDLNTKKTNTITFIEFIIKLIPRIFMLFTSLIPTLHADVAQTDLRFAVLYYNDCMYLAHECLTLSERGLYKFIQEFFDLDYETITNANDIVYDENILERSAAMSTCILVPHLRQSGVNSLLYHLRRERQHLLRCIERIQGFHDVSSSFGYSRCTTSIDECCRHLLKIADVLASLPHTIYYRALGILCNCVCTELVKCILNLIDITKSDCDNILILLDKISNTVRELFVSGHEKTHLTVEASMNKSSQQNSNTERLHRRCPEYQRLQGVISVLSASSMAIIRDVLWMDGKGPLSMESRITASELRCLIKALYSSSSIRDQMLQKLHG